MPNSSNVARFRWSWILKDFIEVLEKNKSHLLASTSSEKREIKYFHVVVSRAVTAENVEKGVVHVQRYLFYQSVNLFLLCRSRFNLAIIITGQQPTDIICEPCRKLELERRSFLTAKSSPNGRER